MNLGFLRSRSGNFGMIFAALSIPVIGSVAFGVDYLQAVRMKSELQNAADAAALSIVGLKSSNKDQAQRRISEAFEANLRANGVGAKISLTSFNNNGIEVVAKAETSGIFSVLLGKKSTSISVSSTVSLGSQASYEVALVLDNTFSMEGQKLTDLQEAALGLISTIQLNPNADVKLGLIPFSRYINVGLSRRNAKWLDVPADSSTTKERCSNKRELLSKTNCRWEWRTYFRDGRELSSKVQKCKYKYGKSQRVCKKHTTNLRWYGCVGSRDYPWNTRDEQYHRKIPGLMNVTCGQEISPLTSDLNSVKKSIQAMVANDETYLPTGFIWGQRMLSETEPLAEGARSSKELKKIMVVMTDGATTASPTYPQHTGTNIKLSEKLMLEACGRTKKESDIRIITVKVEDVLAPGGDSGSGIGGKKAKKTGKSDKSDKSKKVKQDAFSRCASSVDDAYFVNDTSGLNEVFSDIGRQIAGVHLSR